MVLYICLFQNIMFAFMSEDDFGIKLKASKKLKKIENVLLNTMSPLYYKSLKNNYLSNGVSVYPGYDVNFYLKIFIIHLKLFSMLLLKPPVASRWECLYLVCLGFISLHHDHGELYYRPLHRDNWGLIFVLGSTWHISIQCVPNILFYKLISIYSKMA